MAIGRKSKRLGLIRLGLMRLLRLLIGASFEAVLDLDCAGNTFGSELGFGDNSSLKSEFWVTFGEDMMGREC